MNPLFELRSYGQSPWLDYIRRGLITSGGPKRLIDLRWAGPPQAAAPGRRCRYLPRNADNSSRLQPARVKLRDRFRVATTVGFGPRFLHSTGQLYKGGPSTGVFIQVVDEPALDLPIPDKPYTFRCLLDAQSAGDLQALRARGRRVARVRLSDLEEVL